MSGEAIDAMVVGAGPTGLVMAAELARRGVRCRIIDKAEGPSRHSKALGIQARTLEVLDLMGGLADQVEANGLAMKALNLYTAGRHAVRLPLGGLGCPFPWPLIHPQSDTDRVLIEHLRNLGVAVEWGVELTDFSQDQAGVSTSLVHPDGGQETARAGWLLGCDGAHSTVRRGLGLPFEGTPYDEEFLLGDVRVCWGMPRGEACVFLSRGDLLAALPMPGLDRYRLITLRDGPGPENEAERAPTLEEFRESLSRVARVEAEIDECVWLSAFRIHRRMVPRMRVDRALLAGDAAHIHSPVGGQGMNTGIQDAFNLAWKLALVIAGASSPDLLESYHAERHPVARAVLKNTDRATRGILSGRNSLAMWMIRLAGPRFLGLPAVRHQVLRTLLRTGGELPGQPDRWPDTRRLARHAGALESERPDARRPRA